MGSSPKGGILAQIDALVTTFNTREKEAENLAGEEGQQDAVTQSLNNGKAELELLNALFAIADKTTTSVFTMFRPKTERAKADEATERRRITKRILERFLLKTRGALITTGKFVSATGPSEEGKDYAKKGWAIVNLLKAVRMRYEPELKGDPLLANAEAQWQLLIRGSMQKWPEPERVGDTSLAQGGTAEENAANGVHLPKPLPS